MAEFLGDLSKQKIVVIAGRFNFTFY